MEGSRCLEEDHRVDGLTGEACASSFPAARDRVGCVDLVYVPVEYVVTLSVVPLHKDLMGFLKAE